MTPKELLADYTKAVCEADALWEEYCANPSDSYWELYTAAKESEFSARTAYIVATGQEPDEALAEPPSDKRHIIVSASFTSRGSSMYQEATCPFCGKTTVFRHFESHNSPFKVEAMCEHAWSSLHDKTTRIIVTFVAS